MKTHPQACRSLLAAAAAVTTIVCLLFGVALAPRAARARQQAALPAAVPAVPGGKLPDVLVVVLPDPVMVGKWNVSVTYPAVVKRAQSEGHLKRLLALSGWKATDVAYEDRGLATNDGKSRNNRGPQDPAMSSVSFLTDAQIVDWRNGTLPVEPFARTFRDLKNVYVTYFVPGSFSFRGLRQHSDRNLDVSLAPGTGGAYTYVMTIKNHKLDVLNLPRFQAAPSQNAAVRTADAAKREGIVRARRVVGTGLVVLLAVVAAGGMYVWTHRWTAAASAGR